MSPHALYVEKIARGNYVVEVGDRSTFDAFHFATERDAERFVRASGHAFKRTRAR